MNIEFTPDELNRILSALTIMQDSDKELGYPDEAQKSLDLINKIRSAIPSPNRQGEA